MKIYDFALAPNPRRLRIFVAEKGLKIPTEQVDIFAGKNRTPEMLAKNPAGGLPVLELDDGTHMAESVAICRYLEGLHPDPNLMGKDSRDQSIIEMWNRRVELGLLAAAGRAFQHTNELFKARLKQFPEYGETQREAVTQQLQWLDAQIGSKPFIAGDRFTIADITAEVAVDFAVQMAGVPMDPALNNLARWHQSVASRPSAKA
ncbi:glutathione S-transferase family protein [Candidatus Binatus sp.]|uniref:glutathione S-transferase family protein n=1 Tax=Candidatus Binatus sp. TaxID=2811406 RepID=UPI003C3F73F9